MAIRRYVIVVLKRGRYHFFTGDHPQRYTAAKRSADAFNAASVELRAKLVPVILPAGGSA